MCYFSFNRVYLIVANSFKWAHLSTPSHVNEPPSRISHMLTWRRRHCFDRAETLKLLIKWTFCYPESFFVDSNPIVDLVFPKQFFFGRVPAKIFLFSSHVRDTWPNVSVLFSNLVKSSRKSYFELQMTTSFTFEWRGWPPFFDLLNSCYFQGNSDELT